ncbi:DUF3253 domain-containing protein, partial [Streptomyces fungicidicus]
SDAARAVHEGDDDGWRALMEPARRAAWRLVNALRRLRSRDGKGRRGRRQPARTPNGGTLP